MAGKTAIPSARQGARTTRIGCPLSLVVVSLVAALLLLLEPAADATLGGSPCGASGPVGSAGAEPPAEGEPPGESSEEATEEEAPETETAEEPPAPEPPIEEVVEEEPPAEAAGSAEAAKAPGGCAAGSPPPASCLLRSARARVLLDAAEDRARLLLDYSISVATRATVEYRVSAKRSLLLGHAKRMLDGRGVIRIGARLTKAQMAKLRAAKDLAVDLRIPAAPPSCRRYYTLHLTTRHASRSRIVWSQAR
jgi:hypothetical protein